MRSWLLLALATPVLAVSTYKGIEPGTSSQQDVIRLMGAPVRGQGTQIFEYASSGATFVEFDAGGVVQRMSMRFSSPQPKSNVLSALNIAGAPDAGERDAQGNLIEYFGGDHTAVVSMQGRDGTAPVASVTFLSPALFAAQLARLQYSAPGAQSAGGTGTAGNSGNNAIPPPPPDEQVAQFTPNACRDLYEWARTEQEPATKSKNADRRHAILEIRIAAQKGDCKTARTLADTYKFRFR